MSEKDTYPPKMDIPKEFHSFSKGDLFDKCIECEKFLLDEGTEYFIEKAIKTYRGYRATDVIFEYAICLDCAEKMRKKMSQESMRNIENYFAQNVDFHERMELMQANPNNPEAWMDKCMVNGNNKNQLEEYQIYAHCNGRHMELTHMPYLISGEVIDEITHLLSEKTLDELDGFFNSHFGPPPELMEPLPRKRIVLM